MVKSVALCLGLILFCAFSVSVAAERPEGIEVISESLEPGPPEKGGGAREYLSEEEAPPPEEEAAESELFAPIARPVEAVIKGIGSAVEPLLEEKEIKDEKGETKATIKPKEGKIEVPF